MLLWALKNRGKTVLGAWLFFVVSMALMASLPTSLVPSADRGETLLSNFAAWYAAIWYRCRG
jgi:multidrug efflux pump subunit AcrB